MAAEANGVAAWTEATVAESLGGGAGGVTAGGVTAGGVTGATDGRGAGVTTCDCCTGVLPRTGAGATRTCGSSVRFDVGSGAA